MQKSVSPGLAAGIVAAAIVLVGLVYWAVSSRSSAAAVTPAQTAGKPMPQQQFIPKAP